MPRHLAILRSICEAFDNKPAYCRCGEEASNHIHFSTEEYNRLSKQNRLTEYLGLTIERV